MLKKKIGLWKESLRMSVANIWSSKLRSFLTVLGIVIGVTAIIALVTIMQSATAEVTQEFVAMGTGRLVVNANGTALKTGLSAADLQTIQNLPDVAGISPSLSLTATVKSGGAWSDEVTVEGYNEVYFERNPELVTLGRALSPLDVESRNHVALMDETAQKTLFLRAEPAG
jgi:putative ABC transport system permease protein